MDVVAFLAPYLHYLIPPCIGAFIGYLTNKIAIKMLFRPLKEWRFAGIRIPMTPGVIPSKRHQLALNIGEMVGGHLLTSAEIGKALKKDSFQVQLKALLDKRIGDFFSKDLPTLQESVPATYWGYLDVGIKTISYQLKRQLYRYISTQEFEKKIEQTISMAMDQLLQKDIDSLMVRGEREKVYLTADTLIDNLLNSKAMEQWVEDFIYGKLSDTLRNRKTLNQILPDSLLQLLIDVVEEKTPDILEKLANLVKEPKIQSKLINAIKSGVDSFVETLGPMGGMVQNFLNLETIEKVVKDYIRDNEDNISKALHDEDIRKKVAQSLISRLNHYLDIPLVDFLERKSAVNIDNLSKSIASHILQLLKKKTVVNALSLMLRENIEIYLDSGNRRIEEVIEDIAGRQGKEKLKSWSIYQIMLLLRSDEAKELIDVSVDKMINAILQKRIGRIADFIPAGAQDAVVTALYNSSSAMLAVEVPSLVESLNIKQIISEKIDSLDLLRLERLLLSIMEEQFKYINLFGALLGFLIGSLNVVFIYLL